MAPWRHVSRNMTKFSSKGYRFRAGRTDSKVYFMQLTHRGSEETSIGCANLGQGWLLKCRSIDWSEGPGFAGEGCQLWQHRCHWQFSCDGEYKPTFNGEHCQDTWPQQQQQLLLNVEYYILSFLIYDNSNWRRIHLHKSLSVIWKVIGVSEVKEY